MIQYQDPNLRQNLISKISLFLVFYISSPIQNPIWLSIWQELSLRSLSIEDANLRQRSLKPGATMLQPSLNGRKLTSNESILLQRLHLVCHSFIRDRRQIWRTLKKPSEKQMMPSSRVSCRTDPSSNALSEPTPSDPMTQTPMITIGSSPSASSDSEKKLICTGSNVSDRASSMKSLKPDTIASTMLTLHRLRSSSDSWLRLKWSFCSEKRGLVLLHLLRCCPLFRRKVQFITGVRAHHQGVDTRLWVKLTN